MKNRSIIVVVGIVMLSAVITVPSALAQDGKFYLDPQHSEGAVGSDIYVQVMIDLNTSSGGYSTDLYFNPAIVNITNVDFPAGAFAINAWDWRTDHIYLSAMGEIPKGTYTLANLTLRGIAGGTSNIEFRNTELSDPMAGKLTKTTVNGTYTIAVPTDGKFYLDPQHSEGAVGSVIYVQVMIDLNTSSGGYSTDLYFNPAIVNITNVDFPAGAFAINAWDWRTDHIYLSAMGEIPKGTYTLANLTLRGIAEGTSNIEFRNTELSDPMAGKLTKTTVNGTYTAVAPVYGVNLRVNDKKTAAMTTAPNENATYTLTVKNTGNQPDNYTLYVDNADNAAVANLNIYSITNLAAGATQTVLLNVTDETANVYRVNVTVVSEHGPTDYVNTTTTVSVPVEYGVNLTVEGAKTAAKTTTPNVNATYTLTVKNTGNQPDNYTLSEDNADNAAVANLSMYSITNLAPGATQTVLLNVTDETANVYRVNVTVVSEHGPTDYVNTTTYVGVFYTYTIHLLPGYNLISIPLNDPTVTKASELATKIGANCTVVTRWNATSQTYDYPYIVEMNYKDFDIVGGAGYFVNVTAATDVTFSGTPWSD